jgi:DNA polymerase I-like protein with 3'-5' exonuclease and polymerase domains
MIEIEETIDHDQAIIIGEHHDALLFLIREDAAAEVGPKIKEIMKQPKLLKEFKIDLSIPMESDLELGNWGKGEELSKWLRNRKAA